MENFHTEGGITMKYTLHYRMHNLVTDKEGDASITDTDLQKLTFFKNKLLSMKRFGNVEILAAFIMDQNMILVTNK